MYFLTARVELMTILSMAIPFVIMFVLIMENNGPDLANAEFVILKTSL
jgi:hypothetical protein